jgi:hypothetical protein
MTLRVRPFPFFVVILSGFVALNTRGGAAPQSDYEALRRLSETQLKPGMERSSDAHLEWIRERFRTLHDRGLEFMAAHPKHPLRWDVLVLLRWGRTHDIVVRADGTKGTLQPPAERAEWEREYMSRLEDLLQSAEAGPAARREALNQLVDHYCIEIRKGTVDNPRKGLVPALLEWVNELHALDPKSGKLAYLYLRVARMLNALDPVQCRAFLDEKLARHAGKGDPDLDVRRNVENFQRLMRNQAAPATELWEHLRRIEPVFDDAPYRGKVVLIANLAVDWTLHTLQLEELYGKYHHDGLEIIQIAYRNRSTGVVRYGNEQRYDPPPLVQRERTAMLRYVAEKKWPWPVLWDEVTYPKDFQRVWAQNSIPAFLLVGRDGRITREIPGELKWEVRIPRELAQSPP